MKTKKTKVRVIVDKKIDWVGLISIVSVFLIAFIITFFAVKAVYQQIKQSKIKKIKIKKINFSGNEELLYLDPVLLKTYIDQTDKNYALIDIRSPIEYQSGHIVGAVNVPLYTDYQHVYESSVKKDAWLKQARKAVSGKKIIIVYGYSTISDLLLVTINDLRKAGWPIKILGVDWNDWQNNFYQWMPGAAFGGIDNSRYIDKDITGAPPVPPAVNIAPVGQ